MRDRVPPFVQVFPQVPQLAGSVSRLAHAPLHKVWPPEHLGWHSPRKHRYPDEQALLQEPQFEVSVMISTHPAWHKAEPAGHDIVSGPVWGWLPICVFRRLICRTHWPFSQLPPLSQRFPQPPQLAGSADRFTHAPLQAVYSAGHDAFIRITFDSGGLSVAVSMRTPFCDSGSAGLSLGLASTYPSPDGLAESGII